MELSTDHFGVETFCSLINFFNANLLAANLSIRQVLSHAILNIKSFCLLYLKSQISSRALQD